MRILITGGAGYIGSHTLLHVLQHGHQALVYDDFSNSSVSSLKRVQSLARTTFEVREGDILDSKALKSAFAEFKPDSVIHFAGLKAVAESNQRPIHYYKKNVSGTLELINAMELHDCRRIVFSSSATVYGEAKYLPFDEKHSLNPTNPYGRSKLFIEEIIRDWTASWSKASAVLLRYFNPVGANASGKIGEDPKGLPNNLMPYIAQVAIGKRQLLNVYGGDYDTRDGTGERDYVHVEDLASAHLAALEYSNRNVGCEAINVGTGSGSTVLEMVETFQRISGRTINYELQKRRPGDVARSVASVAKAQELLNWKASRNLDDMCGSAWKWQSLNPNGYGD